MFSTLSTKEADVFLDRLGRYHLAWRTGEFFGQGILRYARI